MKRYINIVGLLLVLFAWSSCVDDTFVDKSKDVIDGIPTTVSLSFATQDADKISTRSAIDKSEEYRIYNMHVFVFKKVGGSWEKELVETITSSTSDGTQTGQLTLNITSGEKRIYAIANGHNNPFMPITGIENVSTIDELLALTATMTGDGSVERGQSRLLMSGMYEVNGNADGAVTISPSNSGTTLTGKILLKHVDSKITFNVTTAEGISFTPKEWKVVNVPNKSYVFAKPEDVTEASYFISPSSNFNEAGAGGVTKGGKFTFYMPENRKIATADIEAAANNLGVDAYQLREKQEKVPTGEDKKVTNGAYVYAPGNATYVVMTGSFHQDASTTEIEKSAEVQYTIHLGYENNKAANFSSRRGCDYTYNVRIAGVDAIELEVTTAGDDEPTERQPGAEGDVVKSQTYIYVDAHYETKSITFKKANVSENASFRVKTPYDLDGIDEAASDYKWVWFVQNRKTEQKTEGERGYSQSRNFVPFVSAEYVNNSGDYSGTDYVGKRINIKDLIKLLKAHKDEEASETSIYDADGNASFTVFIDEFYYADKASSWNEFVNVPNREMHILCDTQYSQDQASSLTTSNFLISQKSIKTFYDATATTAWGVETTREGDPLGFAGKSGTSLTNGRFNMSSYMEYADEEWDDYVDSSTNQMVSDYNKVDYACLQRNRDLDGDGTISHDEVKWYLPAINQMIGMWIGRDGFPSREVYLFNGDPTKITAGDAGRREYHFMSSNYKMFWSEEGASIGNFSLKKGDKLDYRCVRNLGKFDSEAPTEEPLDYVQYNTGTRVFDLSRMNSKAVRSEFFSSELAVTDEANQVNRPYKSFKVAETLSPNSVTQKDVHGGKTPCSSYSEKDHPAGTWRMPNQRELSLIQAYAVKNETSLSRTYSSLAVKTKNNDNGVEVTFYQQGGNIITLSNIGYSTASRHVRCVKDLK